MPCCALHHTVEYEPKFWPNYRRKELTEKFYARHDVLENTCRKSQSTTIYLKEIERLEKYDRRHHWYAPRTENQMYGWNEYLITYTKDEHDRELMYHTRGTDPLLRTIGAIIKQHRR